MAEITSFPLQLQLQYNRIKQILIDKMIHLNIVQFGEFILKSGIKSNIYIDMRKLISNPSIFPYISILIKCHIYTDYNTRILGIPLGAIPLATHVSSFLNIP